MKAQVELFQFVLKTLNLIIALNPDSYLALLAREYAEDILWDLQET